MIVKSRDKLDFLHTQPKAKRKGDNPGKLDKSGEVVGITNVPVAIS